jgi:hypothetical protein
MPVPPMTPEQIVAAHAEREALAQRIRRLNYFLDHAGPTSERCAAIIRECRDELESEKLMIEMTLSIAQHVGPTAPRPRLEIVR